MGKRVCTRLLQDKYVFSKKINGSKHDVLRRANFNTARGYGTANHRNSLERNSRLLENRICTDVYVYVLSRFCGVIGDYSGRV